MKLERSKQQILFNYLPGKIFDFGRNAVISIISEVNGKVPNDLETGLILKKVKEQAQQWAEPFRPSLSNRTLNNPDRFVLIEPQKVQAELFPLVFICSSKSCRTVHVRSKPPHTSQCPTCKKGKLGQLRFVKIHRCGNIEPLKPPYKCPNCHENSSFALDDRGSEAISNFRWRCLKCNSHSYLWAGNCQSCSWPEDTDTDSQTRSASPQRMDIEVFRARKTYYVHTATLINIPKKEYDDFFKSHKWHVIAAASHFKHRALADKTISEYGSKMSSSGGGKGIQIDVEDLLKRLNNRDITPEEFVQESKKMAQQGTASLDTLQTEVVQMSGLNETYLEGAGYDLLDSIIPFEISKHHRARQKGDEHLNELLDRIGISELTLIDDFPIVISSYGYTRTDFIPNETMLRPFTPDQENEGRFPIYIDKIKADALMFQVNPERVIEWLQANGISPSITGGTSEEASRLAYFLKLYHGQNPFDQYGGGEPELRLVTGILHTLSHLAIRHAALLCGLDKTSLSEYVIPSTLSFVVYCNNRDGATLGAITSLFDQALTDWLGQILNEKSCVYDPVCYEQGGTCHSCSHLSETSCRLFNHNLSRNYLFGGPDKELGLRIKGFFEI